MKTTELKPHGLAEKLPSLIKGANMKPLVLSAVLILALASTSLAGPAPDRFQANSSLSKKPLYYGMIGSTGTCAASIAFSRDPGKAATIGVPILIVGNLLAAKLFHNHPRIAHVLQIGSGFGCLAGAVAVHAPAPSGFTGAEDGNGLTSGNSIGGGLPGNSSGGFSGSGSTGGSGGSIGGGSATTSSSSTGGSTSGFTGGTIGGGSTGGSGGSIGGGSTTTSSGSTGGSTSGFTGGTIGGGSTGGSSGGFGGGSTGGSTGGFGGGQGSGCITGGGRDCGFPGNGGFNSGNGVGTIPPGRNNP
jgi:hypothetical protein